MPDVKYGNLKFEDAVQYFQNKGVMVSAASWRDFDRKAHARGFTVARVTAQDVLCDIRAAVKDAVDNGQGLEEFKKNLRPTLEKKGWFAPKGEAATVITPDGEIKKRLTGWRLNTIYDANLQSAYAAGRYKQMMETKTRPYWQYKAIMDSKTRTAHAAMNNRVWPRDAAIWDEWYPPNGFRCRCYVKALSARDVEARGLEVEERSVKYHPDEGWDYNPGKAAWGDDIGRTEIERAQKQQWEPLDKKGPADFGRPGKVPYEGMPFKPGISKNDYEAEGYGDDKIKEIYRTEYRKIIGGVSAQIKDVIGEPVTMGDYMINHLKLDGRERFLPAIKDILQDPYEIWLSFEEGRKNGRVVMRRRYVKNYQYGEDKKHVVVVLDSQGGVMTGYTMVPSNDWKEVEKQRKGFLLYGK